MNRMIKRLELQQLEDRATPANLIWTGDADDHWGTNQLGNTNWAFDLLPHSGDNLLFPATSQNHSNSNNLTGLVINSITVQYSEAIISGNGITLTGNFTDSANGTGNDYTIPLTLSAGVHTFAISSGNNNFGPLSQTGGVASIIKEGANGILQFTASNTYTGTTTVNAGGIFLENASGVSIAGDLIINTGFVVDLIGESHIADTAAVTVNSGGDLDLYGHFDRVGSLHVAGGGELDLAGDDQGLLQADSVTLDSGAATNDGNRPARNHPRRRDRGVWIGASRRVLATADRNFGPDRSCVHAHQQPRWRSDLRNVQ